MFYRGESCHADGVALFTFAMTLYVMARCSHHSYQVFKMHYRKWKNEPRSHQLRGSIPLSLLASFWVFAASLFYTLCCTLNFLRMFPILTAPFEDFLFSRLMPGLSGLGTIGMTLAAAITGLFWVEIALKQRQIRTGHLSGKWVPSLRLYRLYCLVLSINYVGVFVAVNVVFGNSTLTFVLMIVSFLFGILNVFVGACLIHWELAMLQQKRTHHGQRGLERVFGAFGNIRVAALKIMTHAVLVLTLLSVFTVSEAMPHGTVPDITIHLMAIMCYMEVSVTLIAIGKYLAAEKVTFTPLLLMAIVRKRGSLRQVVPAGEEGEGIVIDHTHDEQTPIERSPRHSSAMRMLLGFPLPNLSSSMLEHSLEYMLPPIIERNEKDDGKFDGEENGFRQEASQLRVGI